MRGSRLFAAATVVFAVGLGAALLGLDRYDEAYRWVEHTSDVRLVIGRAVGHASQAVKCDGLQADIGELAKLTIDNPVQQRRIAALRESVALACANDTAPQLADQLADLDATERALMVERREHLDHHRMRTMLAFAASMLGALLAVGLAFWLQRRAARAVETSEERFRMFVSSSRDLIRIHDPSGRPTYVSPACEQLLGYTREELMAEVPLSLGHPDDLSKMQGSLESIQKDGSPASTLTYRLRTKDGTYRWFETHTNPIRDARGKLLRFYTSARDITERVQLENKLELEATTDELTGLLNRRGFQMLAGQEHRLAARQGRGVALVFADLDGLKTINDKLGHEHGDRAIRDLGVILRATFREADVVARLGGDEFAVLAYDLGADGLQGVLDRLQLAVGNAASVGPYPLAVSLGTAIMPPGSGQSLDHLIAQADEKMYANKRARKQGAM
jgi:diguanylate cyclase (GGDEF)-like protein/PAS domain S-box-containing protein